MIPDIVAVVFLFIPWACLVYVFRGLNEDQNPLWGNILASGVSTVMSAMIAVWFISGTIVSTSIVSNATYQIPTNITIGEMVDQQSSLSGTQNVLGEGGSGMFLRSSISSASVNNLTNMTIINVHTYDIVYQQYQDIGLMFVYGLLALVSAILFLWYVKELKDTLDMDEEYENSGLEG